MSSQIKQPIHIVTATPQDIAEVVILCGDPKRAEVIAKTFLRSVRVVSRIRCANYYTGLYQNTKITVGTSGMGSASCAIYAFELYYFYNVQTIIRFGSCGSYQHQVRLGDLIIGVETTGENNFQQRLLGTNQTVLTASTCVSKALQAGAKALLPSQDLVHSGLIHSAELFYRERLDDWAKMWRDQHNALAVEMECYTLNVIARQFSRCAGHLLAVVAEVGKGTWITNQERKQALFNQGAEIALAAATTLCGHTHVQ